MTVQELVKDSQLRLTATLRIESGGEPFFGPGKLRLLELIEATGSINQAAKAMGMSYKKAWQMISALNEQSRQPLIVTQTGGNSGGGAIVTDEGRALMTYYRDLSARFQAFLAEETKKMGA